MFFIEAANNCTWTDWLCCGSRDQILIWDFYCTSRICRHTSFYVCLVLRMLVLVILSLLRRRQLAANFGAEPWILCEAYRALHHRTTSIESYHKSLVSLDRKSYMLGIPLTESLNNAVRASTVNGTRTAHALE
jgi:hypothetical protein